MKSAAFSAIMIVGEFVLPDVIVGMIEASATRTFLRPRTLKRIVDHRVRIIAHFAGADRMKDRCADIAGGAC